jgi:cyclophilin family peptidyl-prolyl cis-trans isomerase
MRRLILASILLFLAIPCQAQVPLILLETNFGNIVIELNPEAAPITVENFLNYVNSEFYDGLIFHRVIDDFMIQGGGFTVNLNEKDPCEPIINESYNGLSNLRGTIAMARTSDPNSATCQFYINQVDNTSLDRKDANNVGYCVFGRVISDINVVDVIANVVTLNLGGAFQSFPENPVIIQRASLVGDLDRDGKVNLKDFCILADEWLESGSIGLGKLTSNSITANACYGYSTSISGDLVIVGAPGDVPNGNNAGVAYIYQRDGQSFEPIGQPIITASDGAAGDWFGYSVKMDSWYKVKHTIISAPGKNGETGAVYIFEANSVDPNIWPQQAKLAASDAAAGDWFGNSVSMNNAYVIVGAYHKNNKTGAAYIFKETGQSTWSQEAKLTASDAAADDKFGMSVAIDGDYAIVGSYLDDDNGTDSGSAYIFKRNGTTWTQQAKLKASDGAAGDQFGYSVAIKGEYVIAGAVGNDDGGNFSGSAYIFKRNDSTWSQQAKLIASDAAAFDWFGKSVSISNQYAVIGSYWDDDKGSKSGSAYIFAREDTEWIQQKKITAFDGAAEDYFGNSVSISDDYAVVGAYLDDDKGLNSGSIYLFQVCPSFDLTDDCKIDMADIAAMISNWLVGVNVLPVLN